MMFYATAGRGTEQFLAAEIQNKLHTLGIRLDLPLGQDSVTFRDGKVFLNLATNKDITRCLGLVMSLKSAERVFTLISDYDNSGFIKSKRAFLDKLMGLLSQKQCYKRANFVLETIRNSSKVDFRKSQICCQDEIEKANEGKNMLAEPDAKRQRLEVDNSLPDVMKDADHRPSDKHKQETKSHEKTTSFRISTKCSGKLRKKLDVKRLSRDVAWRVEQASGWKVQLRQPDLEVCIHISDEHVTVGVPLTRQPLSKRNFIQDPGLRAPVAWIMCTLADIKFGDILLDPMCGKATILLEGASNWQDAFYIGNDNAKDQIRIANQNTTSHPRKMEVLLADGLCMPYRDCCADIVVCDAPFNQKHLTSLSPQVFYGQFLQEVHRVLQMNGCCVLLVSQELVPTILTLIQSSNSARANKTSEGDSPHPNQDSGCPSNTLSSSQVELQEINLHKNSSNISDNFCGPCIPIVETKSEENSTTYPEVVEENHGKGKSRLFELVSQHALKLGETFACILKLIKR